MLFKPRAGGGYDTSAFSEVAAPSCTITSPANGTTILGGEPIVIRASVTSAAPVRYLRFTSSDGSLDDFSFFAPYQSQPFYVPGGVTSLTFTATVLDNWSHTGTCSATFTVTEAGPPAVTISVPATPLIAGATVPVTVQATSRVPIASLGASVAGISLFDRPIDFFDRVAPGDPQEAQFLFTVPAGVSSVTLRATAADTVGHAGESTNVVVPIVADARTTVHGTVVDAASAPVDAAQVSAAVHGVSVEVFNFPSPLSAVPDLTGRTPDLVTTISALNLRNPGGVFGADPFGLGTSPGRAVRFTTVMRSDDLNFVELTLGVNRGAQLFINSSEYLTVTDNGAFQEATGSTVSFGGRAALIQLVTFDNGNLEAQLSARCGSCGSIPPTALPTATYLPVLKLYQGQTDATGAFAIANVPTVLNDIGARASKLPPAGPALAGDAAPVAPAPGATTEVGTITLAPSASIYATPSVSAVIRIDERTAAQELTSVLGRFYASGIALLPSGNLAVATGSFVAAGPARIRQIDPAAPLDRNQTVISEGGLLSSPEAIAVEPGGTILVHDWPRLIRVNPAQPPNSNQTLVASGTPQSEPGGLAVKADGTDR